MVDIKHSLDPAGFQFSEQCRFVDKLAATHIYEKRAVFEERKFTPAVHAVGFRHKRTMEGDDVARGQHVGKRHQLHPKSGGSGGNHRQIDQDHPCAELPKQADDDPSDISSAHNATVCAASKRPG